MATLVPGLRMEGRWLDTATARGRGLVVAECSSDDIRRVTLANRSGKAVYPQELGWRKEGADAFDGKDLKVSVESWQMVGYAGPTHLDFLGLSLSLTLV